MLTGAKTYFGHFPLRPTVRPKISTLHTRTIHVIYNINPFDLNDPPAFPVAPGSQAARILG